MLIQRYNQTYPGIVAKRKGHLTLLHTAAPSKDGDIMFVAKPIYFETPGGTTKRIFAIYDTNCPMYHNEGDQRRLVANYTIESSGTVMNQLSNHFHARGIHPSQWRVTPPKTLVMEEMNQFIIDSIREISDK